MLKAMSPAEVTEKLGLHRMRDRSWYVHPRCVCEHLGYIISLTSSSAVQRLEKACLKDSNGYHKMSRSVNPEQVRSYLALMFAFLSFFDFAHRLARSWHLCCINSFFLPIPHFSSLGFHNFYSLMAMHDSATYPRTPSNICLYLLASYRSSSFFQFIILGISS